MQWKVRRTLAFSIHELALVLGSEITRIELVPTFNSFLKDLDEVRDVDRILYLYFLVDFHLMTHFMSHEFHHMYNEVFNSQTSVEIKFILRYAPSNYLIVLICQVHFEIPYLCNFCMYNVLLNLSDFCRN